MIRKEGDPMRKHCLRLCLLAVLCLLPAAASAIDITDWRWQTELRDFAADPAFLCVEDGTVLPVLGAPFDGAWRDPLAEVTVREETPVTLRGTLQGQHWAMVEYTTDDEVRCGWLRVDPDLFGMDERIDLDILRIHCRVTRDTGASVSPGSGRPSVRTLREGETVIAMFAMSGSMYVETEVDGQIAWLFTDPDALEEIPVMFREGTSIRFDSRVTVLGNCMMGGEHFIPGDSGDEDDGEWFYVQHTDIRPGDVSARSIDFSSFGEAYGTVWQVSLPDRLRIINAEAFVSGTVAELRLPAALESCDNPFYGTDILRMVFTKDCVCDLPVGDYTTVNEYAAEEGNPRYSSRDGVLFSADGKTLISYPNGRKDTHYDVPAGVETIRRGAFSDDEMNLPLKTISLPIGLRRIEDYAFDGCGRLQSLTVPLTVTELGEKAFYDCVSLERLSLPPGLSAAFGGYAEQADFTFYNGDNGVSVETVPDANRAGFRWYYAWVDNPAGEGSETLYTSSSCTQASRELPVGTTVRVEEIRDGAANVSVVYGSGWKSGWIPVGSLAQAIDAAKLFNYSSAVVRETGERFSDVRVSSGKVSVSVPACDEESGYWYTDWKDLELKDVILLRSGDDARTMALLSSPSGEAIRFRDAPDGAETGHVYDGVQAIVLERRDGWSLVRTIRGDGWVRDESVCVVYPEGHAP